MTPIAQRRGIPRLLPGVATLLIALPTLVQALALPGGPSESSPFGQYNEAVEDLHVKVLGGRVSVARQWRGAEKRWQFQPNWETLGFTYEAGDEVPTHVWRGDHEYVRGALSTNMLMWHHKDPSKNILFAGGLYRWQDVKGNWVEFDGDGRALRFGDRNITIGTILRDGEGRISGLRDHNDFQVLSFDYDTASNLVRAADYSGREVLYGYTGDQLTSVTDVRGYIWMYTYAGGFLHTKTDPEGRTTTISVSAYGVLESVRDQDGFGAEYRYSYDAPTQRFYAWIRRDGNVVEEMWFNRDDEMVRRDRNGRTVMMMRRDGTHRIFTDENRNETRVEMDSRRRLTKIAHPDGSVLKRQPGVNDVTERLVDENGVVTRYELDAHGNPDRMIEAEGLPEERVTEFRFDASGNLIERRQVVDGAAGDRVTTYAYDDFGNVASEVDAEGGMTLHEYDVQGNVVERTDPRGHIWLSEYDAAGNLVRTEDPLSNVATFEYDKVDNLVRQTDPTAAVTEFVYDGQNRLVARADALGHVWRYEYDAAGNLARSIDPFGGATSYLYDRDGRIVQHAVAAVNVITMQYFAGRTAENPGAGRLERVVYPTFTQELHYDGRGRLIVESKIDGDGERVTTRHGYDAKGNHTSTTNPDGRVEGKAYDAHGRLVARILTNGHVVTLDRDAWDEVVGVTDPRSNRVEFGFDKLGRRVRETRAGGGMTRFDYDAAGELERIVDPRRMVVEYGYDAAGRKVAENTYTSEEETTPTRSIAYSYNSRGDMTGYVDGAQSATYTIDALGRKVAESVDFGPFTKGSQSTFDARGMPATFTGPDGVTYAYEYDAAGNLRKIDIPNEGKITYQSYVWTAPARVLLPGGTLQEFEYDDFLQMTRARSTTPAGGVIMDQRYERDVTGRVVAKETETGSYTYGYDAAYQLTSAISDELPNEEYVYDPAGNRLPADLVLQAEWIYNEDNELLATDTTTYEYDAAGNRVREVGPEGERRYFWDEHGRLARVEDGNSQVVAAYGYDPFARRVWKEAVGNRTYFAYSAEGLVAELDSLGSLERSFAYAPGALWTTQPLLVADSTRSFVHHDHLGAPQAATGASGAIQWSARYSAYGQASVGLATIEQPLRLPGQYFDGESGLHWNWHRYYDTALGRYLSVDPLGLDGGDINLYRYANGSPLNFIDPTGLSFRECFLICVKRLRRFHDVWRNCESISRNCMAMPPRSGARYTCQIGSGACYAAAAGSIVIECRRGCGDDGPCLGEPPSYDSAPFPR